MPKKISKKTSAKPSIALPADIAPYTDMKSSATTVPSSPLRTWGWVAGLVVVLAVILAIKNKALFVVAMVNNKPIFRWEVNRVMFTRFGKQTAESIIGETLIADAAAKEQVVVTQADLGAKEQEIIKGFGGQVTIDDFLRIQGVSKDEFDRQVRLQLLVQKALGKDITITDSDIDNFIATNRALLVATQAGALKEEARQAIFDQKVGEKFTTWFSQLKEKASVVRFY